MDIGQYTLGFTPQTRHPGRFFCAEDHLNVVDLNNKKT